MGKKDREYEDNEREAKLVTACALRFLGYRYAQANGLTNPEDEGDFTQFVELFLAEPNYDLPRGHLHCALFLLQRAYIKEGWLRWDSHEAKVIRELFLTLCREDPPEGYSNEEYRAEWGRRYKPRLWRHLDFVRRRHEQTKYRKWSAESGL
jgi:hypothetical protein